MFDSLPVEQAKVETNDDLTLKFENLRAKVEAIDQIQIKSGSNLSEFLAKRDNRVKRMLSAMDKRISNLQNAVRSVEVA